VPGPPESAATPVVTSDSGPVPASRAERMRGSLLTAGLVAGLTVALRVRDPHSQGSWGLCPYKVLTGWDCPGCGCLRAVNDLTHGDVVAAASSNLVFVLAVPVLVLLWARWARASWTGAEAQASSRTTLRTTVLLLLLGVTVAVFTVVRNTPWGHWLQS